MFGFCCILIQNIKVQCLWYKPSLGKRQKNCTQKVEAGFEPMRVISAHEPTVILADLKAILGPTNVK